MDRLTTFANRRLYVSAVETLNSHGIAFASISPDPGFGSVAVPALRAGGDAAPVLSDAGILVSGWVDFKTPAHPVSAEAPKVFDGDIMGACAIMVLAPCVADTAKLRLIAHVAGDLAPVLPYVNAEMPAGSYARDCETYTYQDAYRLISFYPRRITIAKADDITDAWRVLE
ncbi:MAG: hypothetical protein PHR35_17385 [Kiritimatiellae bacterium]|nr:hypothetical protein [Kiritimatiellia bacterium]